MQNHPALVLNADFRPLNLFPLSTMDWQTAIKNVYEGNLSVVAEYDRTVRSPIGRNAAAVGRGDEELRADPQAGRVHAHQRLPARPLPLPILRQRSRQH